MWNDNMINDIVRIQVFVTLHCFQTFLVQNDLAYKHELSTFEAENRLFHKHAEAQLKKVRAYKKKECNADREFFGEYFPKVIQN